MLRNNMTLSEILLWNQLKQKQMMGYDFHRQKPIEDYVVDFFCPELSLAIEVDGESHEGKLEKDSQRRREIEKLGVHFLRFGDDEVKKNLEGVLGEIRDWIEAQGRSISLREHTPPPKRRRTGTSPLAYTRGDAVRGLVELEPADREKHARGEKRKPKRTHP
jgi:very-short-patch-repair endonuclease